MPKKVEVRENDRILVWLPVTRVTDTDRNRPLITVQVADQKVSATIESFDVVKTEKGNNWPN